MNKPENNRLVIMRYLDEHPVVVLGTLDDYNRPHGAVVYAVGSDHEHEMRVYFLTKSDTQKYHNLTARPAVSLTNYDEMGISTLQAQGTAHIEKDPRIIDMVMKRLTRAHTHAPEWLPPVAKLRAGNYMLVGVSITHARIGNFKGQPIGSEYIFTEAK